MRSQPNSLMDLSSNQGKLNFKDDFSDATTKWTTVLSLDEKKKTFEAIIQKLNNVTNTQMDSVPATKLQNILGQKHSLNELSFFDDIMSQTGSYNPNFNPSISKVNFANSIINQEEMIRKAIISQEETWKSEVQRLECYRQIYEDVKSERLGYSDIRGSFDTELNLRMSSGTKFVSLTVKDAIYVLDPKFVSVVGTYLRVFSDIQTKDTRLVKDYLRPNWNENISFKCVKEQSQLDFEFILVEKDEYEQNRDTIFGKSSVIIDESKGFNQLISAWYPIYSIQNDKVEIGKINLVYEMLPCEQYSLERIISNKELEIQNLYQAISSAKAELNAINNFHAVPSSSRNDNPSSHGPSWTAFNHENNTFRRLHQFQNSFQAVSFSDPHGVLKIKNYLVMTLAILSLFSCFYRPDFLTLVVAIVLFFYLKDEWTLEFYMKTQIGLGLTIISDIIWLTHLCWTSPSLYVVFQQQHVGFPFFLTLLELIVKGGVFVTLYKLEMLKKSGTTSSS